MGFTEKLHAYIAARFYVRLTHTFGEKGKAAFIHATQYYAEQRGRRMAKRAIADGQPLTYETYRAYGEWTNTDEMKAAGCANRSEIVKDGPDWEMHIFVCPWHAQFREMGLAEAGLVYCAHLDNSICRGFNPYICYETPQTLHDCDRCIQMVSHADGRQGEGAAFDPAKARPLEERRKDFEYHCAHSYWSYAKTSEAIFGEEGKAASEAVLTDIAQDWGEEYSETIIQYRDTDFESI